MVSLINTDKLRRESHLTQLGEFLKKKEWKDNAEEYFSKISRSLFYCIMFLTQSSGMQISQFIKRRWLIEFQCSLK
jgi:hypothetical protein